MDALKRSLTEYDITFSEKVFTTNESIDGLMPEPFVSTNWMIMYWNNDLDLMYITMKLQYDTVQHKED